MPPAPVAARSSLRPPCGWVPPEESVAGVAAPVSEEDAVSDVLAYGVGAVAATIALSRVKVRVPKPRWSRPPPVRRLRGVRGGRDRTDGRVFACPYGRQ